jgi:hypothetical protein
LERLTDGVTTGNEIAHTKGVTPHDWFNLDLGSSKFITNIKIWNRTNCCQSRLSDSYLMVSDTPFPDSTDLRASLANATFTFQLGDTEQEVTINKIVGTKGRYVRLQKAGLKDQRQELHILELEVFGLMNAIPTMI